MRTAVLTVSVGLLVALTVPASAATPPKYRGFVSTAGSENTPTRTASQGAGWYAVFRERARGRLAYRVCVTHLGNRARRCYHRKSSDAGRSAVFVALFVNDRGGPGRWQATWTVKGRRVAGFRFTVTPELEG